jgi:tripartite ATP-independent transporter DctM subunit
MTGFFGGLVTFLALGLPIGIAMAAVGLIGVWLAGVPVTIVVQRMAFGLDSYSLIQIPLFLLMGNLMNATGVTNRIYDWCSALVGHWRAGLAQVNVLGSVVFSGLSGSALADAAGMGSIEIRAMVRHGYPPAFSAAITAASASLGPVIPPSIAAVIYAFIANVSVGRILIAGVIPGILMAVAMMLVIHLRARTISYEPMPRMPMRELGRTTFFALPALLAPVMLMAGLRAGWFTGTEVAAVAVVYALFLGVLYRELRLPAIVEACRDTALTTGAIMLIVAGAYAFAWILAQQQIPQQITAAVVRAQLEPWQFLLVVNVVILLLGMVLDTTGIMILVTPVIVPAAAALGIDLVHFGMVMIVNLCIGLLHPPVGMALFVVARIANVPLEKVAWEALPYVGALLVVLLLLIFFPQITLILPDLVYGT